MHLRGGGVEATCRCVGAALGRIRSGLEAAWGGVEMIEFSSANSRALLPTFRTNCPDGSQFAQMGSHFAQNTTTNPCILLSRYKPLLGICTYTKHPKNTPKHPFSWPELESGQNELPPGQNGPQLGKMFEKCLKLF